MQTVLQQINAVPGVAGSLICDEEGRLMAQQFPAGYDTTVLQGAAATLAESSVGLQSAAGEVEMLDLRYNEGRIIVKPLPNAFLLMVCNKTINQQLLLISVNVAMKKLEKLAARPAPADVPPPSPLAVTPLAKDGKGVTLAVEIMKSSANTYWTQMSELVALNRGTALQLSNFYKTGTFKKIKLTSTVAGRSKTFPVMIIADDQEQRYNGRVVISLASAEALQLKQDDTLKVELLVGTGLFGWQGI
jgi:predicted regulator of Ras-like GTPase activity (Roadblock/LC7/MglB family)